MYEVHVLASHPKQGFVLYFILFPKPEVNILARFTTCQ